MAVYLSHELSGYLLDPDLVDRDSFSALSVIK